MLAAALSERGKEGLLKDLEGLRHSGSEKPWTLVKGIQPGQGGVVDN